MQSIRTLILTAASMFASACTQTVYFYGGNDVGMSSTPADAGALLDAGPTFYGNVQAIIVDRCGLCHGHPTSGGAPVSLTEYADTQVSVAIPGTTGTGPMYQYMIYRIVNNEMPPPDVLSQEPNLKPTNAEQATLIAWGDQGAPMGVAPADGGSSGDAGSTSDAGSDFPWLPNTTISSDAGPGQRYIDSFAHAANDLTAPLHCDDVSTSYKCLGFTVPPNPDPTVKTEYAVEFDPYIDNVQHIHHALLFVIPQGTSSVAQPAGPVDCLANALITGGTMLAGYFPGRGKTLMPKGIGLPIKAGDQLVWQVHYDGVSDNTSYDRTGMRMVLSSSAGISAAGVLWIGVQNWKTPLVGNVSLSSDPCPLMQDFTLFQSVPHMHRSGHTQQLNLLDSTLAAPYQTGLLVNVPAWDFNAQPIYDLNPFVNLKRGDQLRVTCNWNAPLTGVNWGEASTDEMCFNFMYVYPAPIVGTERLCDTDLSLK